MTIRLPLLGLGLAALSLAAAPADDLAKKHQEQMQGEWVMVSSTNAGMELPEEVAKKISRVVKGNEFTLTVPGEEGVMTIMAVFKLDPTKTPNEIDVTYKDGPNKDKTLKAIYELSGDTMKTCYGKPEADRPKKFESSEESGLTVSVWKKAKKEFKEDK